jgi:predicted nucleotidyltransferase
MGDIFQDDFRDFIQALNNQNVSYILVGGFAVILHGHARVTGDLDIWVERTEDNYMKLLKALSEFHLPVFDMTKENFLFHESWDVFKFGRKPVAIDIMTKVKGLDFKECFEMATNFEDDGLKVKTLHFNHLLEAKKKAGRLKDLDDIEQLTKE